MLKFSQNDCRNCAWMFAKPRWRASSAVSAFLEQKAFTRCRIRELERIALKAQHRWAGKNNYLHSIRILAGRNSHTAACDAIITPQRVRFDLSRCLDHCVRRHVPEIDLEWDRHSTGTEHVRSLTSPYRPVGLTRFTAGSSVSEARPCHEAPRSRPDIVEWEAGDQRSNGFRW